MEVIALRVLILEGLVDVLAKQCKETRDRLDWVLENMSHEEAARLADLTQ